MELQKFQDASPGSQIKVLAVYKPYQIVFAGPDAPKKILLLKVGDHYHGCNSFGGFLPRSYFCHDCNRGYNTEDRHNHPCKGHWCWSCERNDCKDFLDAKHTCEPGKFPSPIILCKDCNQSFFGESCKSNHKIGSAKWKPLCDIKKKCLSCKKSL